MFYCFWFVSPFLPICVNLIGLNWPGLRLFQSKKFGNQTSLEKQLFVGDISPTPIANWSLPILVCWKCSIRICFRLRSAQWTIHSAKTYIKTCRKQIKIIIELHARTGLDILADCTHHNAQIQLGDNDRIARRIFKFAIAKCRRCRQGCRSKSDWSISIVQSKWNLSLN